MALAGRIRPEVLNLTGKVAWRTGRALNRVGLWLCGRAGALDAMADEAGYWDDAPRRRHW